MLIYIIHLDKIIKFRLPKEISGNYMLNDTDSDGRVRSLINISAKGGKWYFNSNDDVSILSNNSVVKEATIIEYSFYMLNYFDKEKILLYVLPGFEKNLISKIVNNNTKLILGSSSADINYNNNSISTKQIEFNYNNGIWSFKNLDSKVLVFLNKNACNEDTLSNLDTIFVMGLNITFIGNTLIFSCDPSLLSFSNNILPANFSFAVANTNSKEIVKEFYSIYDYFFKSPIFKKKYEHYDILISPPAEKQKSGASGLSQIVPSALMSVTSFVSLYYSIYNYNNADITSASQAAQNNENLITSVIMCLVMLITGILWPLIEVLASKIKEYIMLRVRVINYNRYLKRKDKELEADINEERNSLSFNNISLKECSDAILHKNSNLFCRNVESDAFLNIKCGEGKIKSAINFDYTRPDFIVKNDCLYDEIDKLIEKYRYIDNASFIVSLRNSSLAVIDPKKNYSNFLNSLILQLVALHDYNNLKIVVLTNEGSDLNVIKNLNHCWNNDKSFRFFATNINEAENISNELLKVYNDLYVKSREGEDASSNTYYLIISDCIKEYKSLKIMNKILKKSSLENDPSRYMSLLLFSDKVSDIPNGCEHFINFNKDECIFFDSEMDEKNTIKFKPNLIDNEVNFSSCIEQLSNIPIKVEYMNGVGANLPTKLGFLEMFNVGKLEQLNVMERWKSAPISSTLAAPVGVDVYGNLVYLDLHEKKHGPHGLVAGMTGSGKSEFIVTYLLSLAVNYSPDEVQFVLIDYKGGGLAGAFENKNNGIKLPHLVGTITNLDKSEMGRTLVSIKSELQRRQRVFNQAKDKLNTGSIDIYKYQMLVRDGSLTEPMSHLFIVCDEFAELKAQQPDFMDELVSAARIGRSLGIHLILATQKPSGVVDDQIWSNSKFKVCCKVQTTEDSQEMLNKPDAAYLKDSGRFYLQVGVDQYYILGQSAYSGMEYVPSETVSNNVDNTISFIDNNGEVYRNAIQKKVSTNDSDKGLGEELNNVLRYLIKIAEENGYQYHQLWLENVPQKLYYANLIKKYPDMKSKSFCIEPVIGEYDDPENQRQGFVNYSITGAGNTYVVGVSGSGKSTLFQTIIFSTIINHSATEVNFYIIDMGSEKFNSFIKAPQVGDILGLNDKTKMRYLFYMIDYEIKRRQKYYADNGGDYFLDINTGKAPFPNLVIMLYGIELFREQFEEIYDDLFDTALRMGSKVGIEFIISGDNLNSISTEKITSINNHIALQLNDSSDYSMIFDTNRVPASNPGRGMINFNGSGVEFQTAIIVDESVKKVYLDSVYDKLNAVMPNKAKKVPEVPKKVLLENYISNNLALNNLPIGINIVTAQQEYYNFDQKITLLSSSRTSNIVKFINKMSTLFTNINNNNLIILNYDKKLHFKLDEKVKYYDSDFKSIVSVLCKNSIKLNDNPSDKTFTIIILRYSKINDQLQKLAEEDDDVLTLNDLVLNCNNNNFKFLIFDVNDAGSEILNSDLADCVDNSNGIWVGVDYDSQSFFEMENIDMAGNSIFPSNDQAVIIRDRVPYITRFPTI